MLAKYLISGVDRSRDAFMTQLFEDVAWSDVVWIRSHNKDQLSPEDLSRFTIKPNTMTRGQVSCTIKHFLALHHFVTAAEGEVALIMEDNVTFPTKFPSVIEDYLRSHLRWDLVFEGDTMPVPWYGRFLAARADAPAPLFKKYRGRSRASQGATNAANAYLIRRPAAERAIGEFLPFDQVVDFHWNDLIRRLKLNTYWPLYPVVHRIRRRSTLQYDD